MNPITIIALTSVTVLFLLVLVGVGVALILLALRAHKFVAQFQSKLGEFITDLKNSQAENQLALRTQLGKINGEDLVRAISQMDDHIGKLGRFTKRAENAALAMGEMCKLIVNEDTVKRTSYGAEEYAQPDGEGPAQIQTKGIEVLDETVDG